MIPDDEGQGSRKSKRVTKYKNADVKTVSGLVPRTEKQKEFLEALKTSSQVFVLGPAGTGKTYVTATYAADLYTLKKIDKIVITRPHIAVGKDLGFLKGDLEEKTKPWALPVLDVLEKHLGKGAVDTAIKSGNIEMAPLALMRGRSFDNAFIIVDETQNITTHELKMLLTQVGKTVSQTVGTTNNVEQRVDKPVISRDLVQSNDKTGVKAETVGNVKVTNTEPWVILLLVIGWLLPSPNEIGRWILSLFKSKVK